MGTLCPDPGFDYHYKACRKGDAAAKAVVVGYSSQRVLADASETTGLPRDNFDVWKITREDNEGGVRGVPAFMKTYGHLRDEHSQRMAEKVKF
jgi:hypothetical protein